jgi:predicted AlkP superfamily pyrophosphatase or phosphodiesterase
MRTRSFALLSTLAAAAVIAACSSNSSSGMGQDSGAETGASDGGANADSSTSDAGRDGGSDSGSSEASTPSESGADTGPLAATRHVLLISIDGMHQADLAWWVAQNPSSTLATLGKSGVDYTDAHTTTPSDSFPGMISLVTGGTPKTAGVYYDDSYDRTLYAPGPLGCTQEQGTEVVFDESLAFDDSLLFSGGIDANNLPWQMDSSGNCTHVWPHNFIRTNTIFEVIKFAGAGYTAWSDKHPAYEILRGPSGEGIDDLYTPEVNSDPAKAPKGLVNGIDLHAALAQCDGTTNSLPLTKVTDYTTCAPTVMAYDDTKVQAVINWIDGKTADGSQPAPVPVVFGMNFQTVSVTEKLPVGGYVPSDAGSTPVPSALLSAGIAHVDAAIGKMATELTAKGLLSSTLIIVSAKHGQSPVDKTKLAMETGATFAPVQTVVDPSAPIGAADTGFAKPSSFANPNSGSNYDTNGHLTTDDVGMVWIQHKSNTDGGDSTPTSTIVSALETAATTLHADTLPPATVFASVAADAGITNGIISGPALAAIFGDPSTNDPVASARTPDVFIQPNWGVIYSGSSSKVAEHGGGTTDDTNVMILVSIPSLGSAQTVTTPVYTTQVAPTILKALGLDPTKLESVVQEGTQTLPGLGF